MTKLIAAAALAVLLLAGPAAGQEPAGAKGGVTFNFVDVDLGAVAKFVSDVTGKNFIFDERVKGKITIIAPSPLKADDAFALFSSVLKLKGLTLLPSGVDAYKIVPDSEARQSGMVVSKEETPPMDENFVARLIALRYISSEDALRFLQPVISRSGHISSFGPGNLLLVVDSGLNVEKVLNLVDGIDVPTPEEEAEVVFLAHSSAEEVAAVLNEGIQRRGRKPEQSMDRAVADKRLNAVVLFGSTSMKESMKRLIGQLDIAEREAQSAINVFFLENADAEEMSQVLEKLLKGEAKPVVPGQPQQPRSPFESASKISITPDKATNSLVVVASPSDYKSIMSVIKQLDRRRKQVYVEAMIVEASIDKLRDLGAKWRAAARHKGTPIAIGGVGTVDNATIQNIISGLTGLSVGGIGTNLSVPITQADGTTTTLNVPGFAALFSLSEFEGAVNVLSSPQILTSDNTEAEIIVGANVPFVSKRERDVTTTNTVLSSIERVDVGISLRITPQITEGDYVKLDIYQEISSVVDSSEDIIINVGPTTTKRSTKTSVVVQHDQTVVIGGLMQERDEKTETRVPLLHRIPLLGWFFKFRSTSKVKTNLLVFLTPHIIKDADGIDRITGLKMDEFARSEDLYQEGELLVRFRPEVSEEEALAILEKRRAVVIRHIEDQRIYRVRLAKGRKVKKELAEFLSMPEVEHAEPNFLMKLPRSVLSPGGGVVDPGLKAE